jgi:hypothetical protein
MDLDAAGANGINSGEPPFVYRDDSVGALSSTSSSGLAFAPTRKTGGGAVGALGSSDSTKASAAVGEAGADDDATAAATATAAEEEEEEEGEVEEESDEAAAPPARSPSTAAHKVSRFEQLVSQSFEEAKQRAAAPVRAGGAAGNTWGARVRQAGMRLARNVVKFLNSRSTSMVRCVCVFLAVCVVCLYCRLGGGWFFLMGLGRGHQDLIA